MSGWESKKPEALKELARKAAVKAPAIKTSPWAKLIINKMPYTM
jgi:hypothetical protein